MMATYENVRLLGTVDRGEMIKARGGSVKEPFPLHGQLKDVVIDNPPILQLVEGTSDCHTKSTGRSQSGGAGDRGGNG